MERQANERLGTLMREAGLSAKALARGVRDAGSQRGQRVSCDHTSISRWVSGAHQPRPQTVQLLCLALSKRLDRTLTPADIGFAGSPPDQVRAARYPDTHDEAVSALGDLWRADLGDVPSIVSAPPSDIAWTESSLAWLVRTPRDDLGRRTSGRGVGTADIEALRATTATFSALDNRYGGRHGRHALVQFLRSDLAPLLAGSFTEPVGRSLFAAAAEANLLAAWMSYDAGSHGLAQRYFIQTLGLAEAAGDVLLAGSILDAMSHQATFLGRFREAAQLARAARTGAGGAATPTLESHFAAMEARALAGDGDQKQAERAISESVSLFEARQPDDGPEWMSYFDEAELAAEMAHSYRDLARPREAVRCAEQALAAAGASQRSDYFVTMVLAQGQLDSGDLDEACETAAHAVRLGSSVKSGRAVEYLRQFRTSLATYGKAQAAAHLADTMSDEPLWHASHEGPG